MTTESSGSHLTHTHGLIIHTAMDGPIIPAGDGVLHGEDGAGTSVSDIMTRGMRGAGDLHGVGPEGGVQAGVQVGRGGLPGILLTAIMPTILHVATAVSEREAAGLHRRVPVEIMEDTVFPATGTGFRATRHRQVLQAATEGNTTHRPPSTIHGRLPAIVEEDTLSAPEGIAQAARAE